VAVVSGKGEKHLWINCFCDSFPQRDTKASKRANPLQQTPQTMHFVLLDLRFINIIFSK
jgi:hypothetical protein